MKNKYLKHGLKALLLVIVLVAGIHLAEPALAQSLSSGGSGLNIGGTGDVEISGDIVQDRTLGEAVVEMVNFFIGFLGVIATIMFVYAGVLWVTSAGNDESITKAKKIMTYAALGLLVVILSYSIVRFVTSSAGGGGGGQQCTLSSECPLDNYCTSNGTCAPVAGQPGFICNADNECPGGWSCLSGTCSPQSAAFCTSTVKCAPGQFCSASGVCVDGTDVSCTDNSQCVSPKTCDPFGLCRNQNSGSGSTCTNSSDCSTGFVCNQDSGRCEIQGTSTGAGVTGEGSRALSEEALENIDESVNALGADLSTISTDINQLSDVDRDGIQDALNGGSLADKMANVNSLIGGSSDPDTLRVLDQLLRGLERLQLVREQLDELRAVMPESEETIAKYDVTSAALDELVDDPVSGIKLRRFEQDYRELKDMIRRFPVVISRINGAPGEGNVPFTVTFDGLGSTDPTGGTISDYKWSFIDNDGNLVSLGNSPVVVHEFTQPNTYSVNLQVSTNNMDDSGYKRAIDGISTIRIKANPPTSQVAFRINGVEIRDVHHVTLEEAKAGISFDPSITVPALGRTIETYEWIYGDTQDEERTVPATVVHSYSKAGEYFVTLRVTDSQGIADKRVIKLIVKSTAADIDFIPAEGNVNTEFRFRGINSRSDDGIIRSYEWLIADTQGNAITSSQQENFYYTFDRPGKYNVELLVTDTSGASDKTVRELTVVSRKPVASFDYNVPRPNHPNTLEFSAAGSYDPDQGDQITYSWDFDGDGQYEMVDAKDVQVTYTYRRTGQFKAALQVTDSFGQRSRIEKNVTIDSVLAADITIDKKAAQVGEEITFTAESDAAVAYLWEFGDGETASTEESTVTHTYTSKGKYKIGLNFFDRDDNSALAQSFVLVGEGDDPIASADALVDGRNQVITDDLCGAGLDGYIVTRSDNISFTGRGSVNRDGSTRLLTYDWKFNNGTRNSQRDFTHRFADINLEGECSSVSLVVRDEISGKVSTEDILHFKVVNKTPNVIDFVVESDGSRNLITPTKVKLKIVGAKDEDGQIKKYRWWYYREGFGSELLGVHSTSNPETEMIIVAQGQPDIKNKYFFAVEITDNDNGVFDSDERFGEVSFLEVTNGPNLSPVAEFTVDKTTIAVGDSITFISQSYDPQGDILPMTAYQWDFDGDGSFDDSTSGSQVNRQFNTPGEYEVRLRVTQRGLSTSASRKVFVEPTNSFPQAAYTYTIDGNTVHFNGDVSRYDPDLDDTTLRFEWDFDIIRDQNGNGINDDDIESSEVSPTFTYASSGLYRARLLVKDSLGQIGVVVRDVNLDLSAADRELSSCRSIGVNAPNQAITVLLVTVTPCTISRGSTADIQVEVRNADNSAYSGNVFFEILEGSGEFTPNPVRAVGGKAQTVFTAVDSGPVRISVKATDTYYGDVSEQIIVNVN